jgi:hypothetical protein
MAESLLQLEWEAISSSDIVCRVTFVAGNQNELVESVVMLSCLLLRHRLHPFPHSAHGVKAVGWRGTTGAVHCIHNLGVNHA